ncbi:hypothetical protein PIB30_068598 [Stylosanthes scabra]|uniref:Leucine-rich repeat-containing N-terminal plant-type domain-containing protein n=1 Tax=Stylosanthes scabra TaxID=79078 RepID=A0ABU6VMR6_9FABA|nr:hypothetical protein [Stylosanthes scabra]
MTTLIVDTTIYDEGFYYHDCPNVYPKTRTWENGIDCCSWSGVTCDSMSGHVIGLDLSCSALGGDIPSQISHLSKLQSLDLSFNSGLKWKETTWKRLLQNATGLREILLEETNMSSISLTTSPFSSSLVTLSLVYTGISGQLTSHILRLPNLQNLNLAGNRDIQIHVPNLNCNTCLLSILDLSYCGIQGSIPSSFSNLTYLTSLILMSNDLNGLILPSLSNLQHLTHLDLSHNELTGLIPSSISNLHHLTHLALSFNALTGLIPTSISHLHHLTYLDLSFNALTGLIPTSISNLHHLVYLDLSRNELTGQIPNVFEMLPNLQTLFLHHNNLQGNLSSSLFTLTQLSQLDCSCNQIEGPLPDQVAFSNLTELLLNDNMLDGTIPSWALSLKSLGFLDLSNNLFTGHISGDITSSSLEYLYLCNNKLQGRHFPESIFHLVNLTHLCLSSENWSGTVHFPLFSKLQNLEYLSLSGCSSLLLESGMSVNYTFSNLRELQLLFSNVIGYSKFPGKFPVLEYLELSNNKLEGNVPKWIYGIHSLGFLKLSHNMFTSIGHQFPWRQLEYLDLSFNMMVGDISSFICNATFVKVINLSHNRFTGTFPQCLANTSSFDLDLQMNKLHGILPDTFENLYLHSLNLNGNQFHGLLPKSLSNCTDLVDLNLGNNQFEDTFPNWLQNLSYLKILDLGGNNLYGPVANLESQNMFPSLIIFDISCNNFSGSLPKAYITNFQAMKIQTSLYPYLGSETGRVYGELDPEYDNSLTTTIKGVSTTFAKIPSVFVNVDLSGNKFEGEIPDVIGELQALRDLNLSHNRLVGHIPNSLGNLTNLESLDLSSNMLIGEIPTELTNLNFLEVLNVSQNQLAGSIPRGKQFDTFLNDSYGGNVGLCGLPLSIQCNNVSQQQYPPSEAEDKFGFGWKPVTIGYACGMVLGIGLGWCVFWIGKPEWLVIIFGGTTTRIKRRSRGNRRRARATSSVQLAVAK